MSNPTLETAIEKLGSSLPDETGVILMFLPEVQWKNPTPGLVPRKKI